MGNENTRNLGFEADITGVIAIGPRADNGNTPILSAAIDTRLYPRCRILLVAQFEETSGGDAHTVAFTVTESATSGGDYTAAVTSGTLTAMANDGIQWASIKRNLVMPWIIVTATGSSASLAGFISAEVLFINPSV